MFFGVSLLQEPRYLLFITNFINKVFVNICGFGTFWYKCIFVNIFFFYWHHFLKIPIFWTHIIVLFLIGICTVFDDIIIRSWIFFIYHLFFCFINNYWLTFVYRRTHSTVGLILACLPFILE